MEVVQWKAGQRKYSLALSFTALKTAALMTGFVRCHLGFKTCLLRWALPRRAAVMCLCACLSLCAISASAVGSALFYCYSDLHTGDPLYLVLEYTNWWTVALIGSSTFWLRVTSGEPLVYASTPQQARTVPWQASHPGKSKWEVFQAVTQIVRILHVLSGNSLSLRTLAWTVADGFPDVFPG